MNRIFSRPARLCAGLFLLFLVLAAGCSQDQATQSESTDTNAASAVSVAVVDEARIFNESNAGLEGVKMLNELNKSLREQLSEMQSSAQDNGTDADVAGFRGAVQRYQEIMNNQQRALFDSVQQKYVTVLSEYRQAHDIDVVLNQENALSYNPEVDITDDVIAALNEANVELPEIDPSEFDLEAAPAGADATMGGMMMAPETAEEAPAAGAADENATQDEPTTDENATQAEPAAENASEGNATE